MTSWEKPDYLLEINFPHNIERSLRGIALNARIKRATKAYKLKGMVMPTHDLSAWLWLDGRDVRLQEGGELIIELTDLVELDMGVEEREELEALLPFTLKATVHSLSEQQGEA